MADSASDSPLHKGHEDHPETIGRNVRYGLILFAIWDKNRLRK